MIRPVPVSASYRLSVAAATAAMLAVPLVYAGFVLLLAAGVVAWAVAGVAIVRHAVTLMLYLAILGAGLTVLFFLGKAFFTRPRTEGNFQPIDLAQHPALADLVRRVCTETGAPEPSEVAVDMGLNGGASLIHPFWGLFNNRYRLTVGLPLVAISDRQHMAHIIAHEVGHFSQGGAMRVRQLIHWSQYYLSHLVDGRDRWDVWLASKSDGTSYMVRFFAWTAAGGVWLSRRLLRLLLRGTLLVNARMSREMEFHADLYAIRVAGSVAFAGSVETFAAGAAAMFRAMQIAQRAAAEGRYPEDFAALAAACFAALTAEERRELARQGRYTIGLGFDSHPDDTDRLDRSDKENDPGVVAEHGPASGLFSDFEELCRAESKRFYDVESAEMVPVATLLEEDRSRDNQDAGRINFFGAVYEGPVWLRVGELEPVSDHEWEGVIKAGEACLEATLPYFQRTVGGYSKWVTATVVLRRLEARLPVDWMRLELEQQPIEGLRERMYKLERTYAETLGAFYEESLPLRRRLSAAWERRERLAPQRAALFALLFESLRAMERADEPTTRVAVDLAVLSDLGAAINENMRNLEFMQTIQAEFEAAVRHANEVESVLEGVTQPFLPGGDLLTFARPDPMDTGGGVFAYLGVYGGVLTRIRDLRLRMMGQLAELALEVESTR